MLSCVVVFCAACLDGYPGKDVAVLVPAEMSQLQRLQRMNEIGQQSYLDIRWRYKLADVCALKVTTGSLFSKESKVMSLKRGVVVRSIDRSDKTHDIHLQVINGSVKESLPLLETANWVDAVSFFTLATYVQRDCLTTSVA